MEPDKEEWLAHRILRAEREPVSWDKTHVWERIDGQLRPARSRPYYGAAAAALTILMVLSYFTIDETDTLIPAPDVITRDHPSTEIPSGLSEMPKEVPIQQKVIRARREAKPRYALKENTNLQDTRSSAVAIETMDILVSDKADSTGMLNIVISTPQAEDVAEEKIRPVIGVISDNRTPSLVSDKRRRKLHRLDAGGTEQWTPPLSGTITLAGKK